MTAAQPSSANPSERGDDAVRDDLVRHLRLAREALVWKLDGLGEHDVRRPLVPTGSNLLGLVKHAAGVEAGYLGLVFGRPFPEQLPWMEEDAPPNADMRATAEESREEIVGLSRRVGAHSEATLRALPLGAVASAYVDRIHAVPAMQAWCAAARRENDFIEEDEPYRQRA